MFYSVTTVTELLSVGVSHISAILIALGKHVVGELEDGSNDFFENFSTRFV